ncbi:MAG: hypothetical protein AAGI07_04330 [Bacteroidota bacterium]
MNSIKKSIICQNIKSFNIDNANIRNYQPIAGDVAIFEVLALGSLNAIQNEEGRNCYIFTGDKIMLSFGNRYASNQFEGYVPEGYSDEYDLIGKGGVVGKVHSMASRLELKGPTKLRLVGYATDHEGEVINTIYHSGSQVKFNVNKARSYKTILSLGSSMDSGKTTSAAHLCRGLKTAGFKVAYIKLTGTVFNKDRMLANDCGADAVADFSELGFPSTYLCSLDCLMNLYESLLSKVASVKPDYVVIEIADGLYQRETNQLLNYPLFRETIDHVMLSCGDSLAANTGIQMLMPLFGHRLFALSGIFTTRPLLIQEVEAQCKLPVLTLEKMQEEQVLMGLLTQKLRITA